MKMYENIIDKIIKIVYGDKYKTWVRKCLVLDYDTELKTLSLKDLDSNEQHFVHASEIKHIGVINNE